MEERRNEKPYNLRSEIKRRRSIHENSPVRNPCEYGDIRNSPLMQRRNLGSESPKIREASRSPVRFDRIYPTLPVETQDDVFDDDDALEAEQDKSANSNSSKDTNKSFETNSSNNNLWIIAIIFILIGFFTYSNNFGKSKSANVEKISCSEFLELAKNFPNQDENIFKSLTVSTQNLYNENQKTFASVYTFFSTDQEILDDLIESVAKIAKKCTNQANDPINITSKDLNKEKYFNDNTKIISEYKNELKKRKILVINLNDISTKVLPSLHSFTDTFNPLVEKSMIFLTIKVPQRPSDKPIDYIHNYLKEQYHELSDNIRGPLITRLLDMSFFLKPSH